MAVRAPRFSRAPLRPLASEMADTTTRLHCHECGAPPPNTKTLFTLIAGQGWRVEPRLDENGRRVAVLWCPLCSGSRPTKSRIKREQPVR